MPNPSRCNPRACICALRAQRVHVQDGGEATVLPFSIFPARHHHVRKLAWREHRSKRSDADRMHMMVSAGRVPWFSEL
jgi:hypothetical protein